jgi:NitT/TauT family transport system substrate-binding protein
MQRMKDLGRIVVATAGTVLALAPQVAAEDLLKVAVAQRGAWETAAPYLGQQAGIFKKHGIVLELSYADSPDTNADGFTYDGNDTATLHGSKGGSGHSAAD